METITDPAVIRACDEPDERGDFPCCADRAHKESLGGDSESGTYNRSSRPPAGPRPDADNPWALLPDDHPKRPKQCGGCGTKWVDAELLRACERRHGDDITTPAPVGAAVALDLRSHESLLVAAYALRGASSLADDDDTAQWLEVLAQQFEDDAANTKPTPAPVSGAGPCGNATGSLPVSACQKRPEGCPCFPSSGAGLDLDAAHVRTDPACTFHDGATPKASRGKSCPACMRLDLGALRETICDKFTGMAEVRQAADLLVADVRRLRQDIDECWVPLYHDTKHERDQATARAESAEAEVVTLRAKVSAVEPLADQWADRKRSDGMSGNAWIGLTLSGVAADLRAALAVTTGEGEHVAREVFTADGIPFVRCSCSTAKSPTSHRWLSEHVPNGGVAELQAVVKRQAEGAKA